ncbi:MAG: YihY/virulence factor BrkB family protein, partial [Leptospiraceae bacterium]|nr:YihY/virulence factor BrkB family protein [Leptospiraceae bacterium]
MKEKEPNENHRDDAAHQIKSVVESSFKKVIEIIKKGILSGDLTNTTALQSAIIKTARLIGAAAQRFLNDEAVLRAASISYSLIISFVPSLVVVLLIGARVINTDEYFELAKEMVRKNGIPIDIDPYINVIKELIRNAGAIGGVGLLILMFTATSVLRNVENALNRVWRVINKRPFIQKISGFLMVMIFGPLLLAIGISYAQWLLGKFASPDLEQIRFLDDRTVVLGQKYVYIEQDGQKRWRYSNILDKIDFDYNNRTLIHSGTENKFLTLEESAVFTNKVQKPDLATLSKTAFTDIAKKNQTIIIITSDGTILRSSDAGEIYYATKIQREQSNWLFNVRLNSVLMITEKVGFIAGSGGVLLKTTDGGEDWSAVGPLNREIDYKAVSSNSKGEIFVVGSSFTVLKSTDQGETFESIDLSSNAADPLKTSLFSISFNENYGYIAGDFGTIMMTQNGGSTWVSKIISRNYDFRSVFALNSGASIVAGDKGALRIGITDKENRTSFIPVKFQTESDIHGTAYNAEEDKIMLVGANYNIIASKNTLSDILNSGKDPEFEIIQESPFWRKLISALGNVILPFAVIWLLFFLVYLIIPYTEVNTKAAALGAAVTSTIWVVFLLGYKYYLTSFSVGTFAIYGTLAAIPLTLLMVYISALIMLFGAEVAFLY